MFEQYKMVMVVRADLKMGKGKIAAQVRPTVAIVTMLNFQYQSIVSRKVVCERETLYFY